MRAFVGLPLPDDMAEALARRAAGAGVGRAVAAGNLHVTLVFLDDQPEMALVALHEELERIALPAPVLRLGGLDFFGGGRSRVLAATVAPDPALAALRDRVRAAARSAGIALPHDRFRPHVTLVRLPPRSDPAAAGRLQALIGRGITADLEPAVAGRLVLYRSHLDRAGAWYEELADWPLGLDGGGGPGA